jgi:hypothetical protein
MDTRIAHDGIDQDRRDPTFLCLCEQAGEDFDPKLNKAEASKEIDRLREQTGRAPAA